VEKTERENVAINSDFTKKSFGNEKWNSRPIKNDMFLYIIKKGDAGVGKRVCSARTCKTRTSLLEKAIPKKLRVFRRWTGFYVDPFQRSLQQPPL